MSLIAPNVAIANNAELNELTQVRSLYQKLHTDFHVLTEPFGIRISRQMDRDLAQLIASIDAVDRELDEFDDVADRQAFSDALVVYLKGEASEILEPTVSEELASRMHYLREIIQRREIRTPFTETVVKIFEHTEGKRNSTGDRQMIGHLVAEWRLTGRLPVLILGQESTPEFEAFFYLLCELMMVIDMIYDARSDYRNGQINVRPDFLLYCRLLTVLSPLPKLLLLFPEPLQLFKYGFSFLQEVCANR